VSTRCRCKPDSETPADETLPEVDPVLDLLALTEFSPLKKAQSRCRSLGPIKGTLRDEFRPAPNEQLRVYGARRE